MAASKSSSGRPMPSARIGSVCCDRQPLADERRVLELVRRVLKCRESRSRGHLLLQRDRRRDRTSGSGRCRRACRRRRRGLGDAGVVQRLRDRAAVVAGGDRDERLAVGLPLGVVLRLLPAHELADLRLVGVPHPEAAGRHAAEQHQHDRERDPSADPAAPLVRTGWHLADGIRRTRAAEEILEVVAVRGRIGRRGGDDRGSRRSGCTGARALRRSHRRTANRRGPTRSTAPWSSWPAAMPRGPHPRRARCLRRASGQPCRRGPAGRSERRWEGATSASPGRRGGRAGRATRAGDRRRVRLGRHRRAAAVGRVRRDRSRGTRARVGQLAEQIRERIIDGRIGHGQASSWAGGTGVPGGRPLFFSTSSACWSRITAAT